MNFYIADTHFGHDNVIRFDGRPFGSVEEMEEILVLNWNAVVKTNDTAYVLGDFCFGKVNEWLRILRKLKGNKVLIAGNHDLSNPPPELREQFADIKDYMEIVDNGNSNAGRKVILSHYPIMCYKHSNNHKYFMLHGHVHNTAENDLVEKWTMELRRTATDGTYTHASNLGQIYNVGCMLPYMNYTPRTLDQIVEWQTKYLEGKAKRFDIIKT